MDGKKENFKMKVSTGIVPITLGITAGNSTICAGVVYLGERLILIICVQNMPHEFKSGFQMSVVKPKPK